MLRREVRRRRPCLQLVGDQEAPRDDELAPGEVAEPGPLGDGLPALQGLPGRDPCEPLLDRQGARERGCLRGADPCTEACVHLGGDDVSGVERAVLAVLLLVLVGVRGLLGKVLVIL
eukprot:15476397-Alexandrium_andersonii.AAC.1